MVSTARRGRAVYLAYRSAAMVGRALPWSAQVPVARVLGAVGAVGLPGRRAMVARHLQRVSGGTLAASDVRRWVRRAFASYVRYWLESFRLPAMTGAEVDARFSIEGIAHIEGARDDGRGTILALPHLGGWELAGAWLVRRGFPLAVVVEPLEPPELFAWFAELRRALGFTVIPLGEEAGSSVMRALRANQVVALLCDRDLAGGGVEVDFFGERTTLPAGPAALALRTGAALVPAGVYFTARGGHAVVLPPLEVSRAGRFRDDVAAITQELAGRLETLVRRAPEQWHLFQPNWPSDRL